MVKQFTATFLAIIVAAGVIYGFLQWQHAQEQKKEATVTADRMLEERMEDISKADMDWRETRMNQTVKNTDPDLTTAALKKKQDLVAAARTWLEEVKLPVSESKRQEFDKLAGP